MPFLIPVAIAAIGAGVGIEESLNSPGTPNLSKAPPLTPLTAQQNQNQQTAVGSTLPNLQSLTGGSLSPEYAANFGALQSGLGNDPQATGNIQAAINSFFGINAPGTTGLTPVGTGTSGGGILDLLKTAGPSGVSSGTGAPPGGFQPWIQSVLNGNEFKGLAA